MKVFSVPQIQACDKFTIENEPIVSVDLMERAASRLFEFIVKHYSVNDVFVIFAGSGNNGGDALALARMLFLSNYKNLSVVTVNIGARSADAQINFQKLHNIKQIPVIELNSGDDFPKIENQTIVIDGIFGSGLNRPVSGYWGRLISYINTNATAIIAIDIPSGLFVENNTENNGSIIQADITLSFQFPKLAFFFAENNQFVGDWKVLDIGLHPDFIEKEFTPWQYILPAMVKALLKCRSKFAHKGTYGHALLVAGSYQMTGAAVLASRACLRSGVGLLTTHVPQSAYEIMQTAVPEAMLCIDESELEYCEAKNLEKYTAIGVGPGIGRKPSRQKYLFQLLNNVKVPVVIDADALNILAAHPNGLQKIPAQAILTPHPGEFDRLTHAHKTAYERLLTQQKTAKNIKAIIVLKGAYTSVAMPDGMVYFNATGNPGMATAGSGDVLTGIILSLLAQGYQPKNAALLAVFLHGLAGDFAQKKYGQQALIASDIINNLGNAFLQLKQEK